MSWLTADLPGTGGIYKTTPEDFQVEEIPLYDCCGSGEHLYLWIEKTGLSTRGLVNQLQQELSIRERDIGYAGLKDANATTRQWISIPAAKAAAVESLNLRGIRILKAVRHTNKLRLGHLAGNRFSITLRETVEDAMPRARAIMEQLEKKGVPNLFGEQRYGILGNSARLGLLLLKKNYSSFCTELMGDPLHIKNMQWRMAAQAFRDGHLASALELLPRRMRDEQRLLKALAAGQTHRDAVLGLPKALLRLFLSAAQSRLFDQLVQQRMQLLDLLEDGDIACKHINGACFRVEDAAEEQPRCDRFEISPTAPLFGSKVMLAEKDPGNRERDVLNHSGLSIEDWAPGRGLTMPGERRPLRVPIMQYSLNSRHLNSLTLSFILPKGSYATSVLREVIKEVF